MNATHERKTAILPTTILVGCLLTLLAGAALAAQPATGEGGIVFTLDAPEAGAVFLAGDFNGWNATADPLTKGSDGTWSVTVALDPGSYEYKFVVDDQWREDPDNPDKKDDPFGGSNSVVTVAADGSVARSGATAPAPGGSAAGSGNLDISDLEGLDYKKPGPQKVAGGIAFTYVDGNAGSVNLAGSMNGWSADSTPLVNDGDGNWAVVVPLDEGEHQYKFVVDGNWMQDPANPQAVGDGYGGSNSAVTVDADGNLVAAAAAAPGSLGMGLQGLETRATIDGRYLTRFQYAKNMPVSLEDETVVDSRARLQRPSQTVDLNVRTEVSDAASTMMRLRLDSDQNIIQNNVAAILDEAYLEIHPTNFHLKAYWNQEMFSGEDLLRLGGNIDLPGTIMNDHLMAGKGTAGALFTADPLGVRLRFFAANSHNFDYYNDPDLYDNVGQDLFALRLSRQFGKLTVGVPFYAERALTWLDFGSLTPGLVPPLDAHRDLTGDDSTWYEVDNKMLNVGLDLAYDLEGPWWAAAEMVYVGDTQAFVTGNEAGQNNTNGSIDVPFYERGGALLAAEVRYEPEDGPAVALQHQRRSMTGADAGERYLSYAFLPQALANKQFTWLISDAPAAVDQDSTELRLDWAKEDKTLALWLRRTARQYDYGVVGASAPEDSTVSSHDESIWYLAAKGTMGDAGDPRGRFELEAGFTSGDRGVAGLKASTFETILRWDRDLTRNTGLIADLRYIRYTGEGTPDAGAVDYTESYFNPFLGFRYTPIRQLQLVLAYGIDPLDYSIDYEGRHLGRWMHRMHYLFDHPGKTVLDAENFLENARVVTLRAQMTF
jgi:hypothetical protein